MVFVISVIPNFGFEDMTLVLIESVPGHCFSFTSQMTRLKSLNFWHQYTTPSIQSWVGGRDREIF